MTSGYFRHASDNTQVACVSHFATNFEVNKFGRPATFNFAKHFSRSGSNLNNGLCCLSFLNRSHVLLMAETHS